MPTLARSDFQHISHKEGNVFFNQHTGKLDVRGGNFLSRLVTWIKSKYNPGKVNQEYKEAADSFIAEVKQIHNQAVSKYHEDYQISEEHLNQLYELGKQNKPLAARQVRQVLKQLETVPSTLELAENYFSPKYSREQLILEISKYPKLSAPYQPSEMETEKLSFRIKGAMMEAFCQQEGNITEETMSSIAQKIIEEYVASQLDTLEIAFKHSGFEYCQEKIAAGLSRQPELYMHYCPDPADIEELSLDIKEAIVDQSLRQEAGVVQVHAVALAEKIIAQHTEQLIKTMSKQKVNAETKLMGRSSKTAVEKEEKEHAEQFTKQVAAQKAAASKAAKQPAGESAPQANAKEATKKPVSPDARPKTDTESQKKKFEQLMKKVKDQKLNLPAEIEKQMSSGKIDSMAKLIEANNQYIAQQITHTSIRSWYAEKYSRVRGKPPSGMEHAVLTETRKQIQAMPVIVNHKDAKQYTQQVISGYVKRHSQLKSS